MGHPIHPLTVHFPVASWIIAVFADFAGLYAGVFAWKLAATMLAIGCLVALVSIATGLMEFSKIPDDGPVKTAWMHMGAMLSAFLFANISLFLHFESMRVVPPSTWAYVFDGALFLAVGAGGWLGGHLVYGHGVGQRSS